MMPSGKVVEGRLKSINDSTLTSFMHADGQLTIWIWARNQVLLAKENKDAIIQRALSPFERGRMAAIGPSYKH